MNSKDINPFDSFAKEDFDKLIDEGQKAMKEFVCTSGQYQADWPKFMKPSYEVKESGAKAQRRIDDNMNLKILVDALDNRLTLLTIELLNAKNHIEQLEHKMRKL